MPDDSSVRGTITEALAQGTDRVGAVCPLGPLALSGFEIIAKLATVLEVEPAELLRVPPGMPERVRCR
jgi:hypothetical protein